VGWNLFGCVVFCGLFSGCGGVAVFRGVFAILGGFGVVNLWCECGDLCGGCGVLAAMFSIAKNAPLF
jgi:hypothetical protein